VQKRKKKKEKNGDHSQDQQQMVTNQVELEISQESNTRRAGIVPIYRATAYDHSNL
jgi:hypothetical protein